MSRCLHATAPTRVSAITCVVLALSTATARADVSLNNMFGDHMVLQQGIANRVWGKADAGEAVTVTLGGQSKSATAGPDGAWHVLLDPVMEYGGPHTLTVKGRNTVTFNDVLIGEVWVCAGQSNMQWSVNQSKGRRRPPTRTRRPSSRKRWPSGRRPPPRPRRRASLSRLASRSIPMRA